MNSESGIRAMGEVVTNLVWKHLLRGPSAGKMHCTSTTMASQAPVRTTFSWLQEVTGHGNAVTHGDFVGSAADAGDGDALGAQALGVGDHLGIIGVVNDHFGQGRIVTVNDDVHRCPSP